MTTPRLNEFAQPIGPPVDLSPGLTAPPRTSLGGEYCDVAPLDVHRHGMELHAAYGEADDDRDWTYLPYGPFPDVSEFIAWLTAAASQTDPTFYTIVDLATGEAAGLASYLRIDPSAASIEVGHIHLAPRLQQTAAATEAMYLMMKRVFDSGYRRYEWKCDDLNAPSRSAATRLGFTYEGTFRQATHYKGRNRDTAWFSVLHTEWQIAPTSSSAGSSQTTSTTTGAREASFESFGPNDRGDSRRGASATLHRR